MYRQTLVLSLALLLCFTSYGRNVSPFDYGLREAKNGEERFWALYNAHSDALKKGAQVDYSGIKQLDIEIPGDEKSIVLSARTDFKGLVLRVNNTQKDQFYLFKLSQKAKEVNVSKEDLCTYRFSRYPELARGIKLLIVEDKTPWVEQRIGYDYGAWRKEVLVLQEGKALNQTIAPYNTKDSNPTFKFVEESNELKFFKNLTLEREAESTKRTYLLKVQYVNNLEISGLNISTPDNRNQLAADYAVAVYDCANLTIKNVNVNGTYSLANKFGYAFFLNNIWNTKVKNMYGRGEWGVFGCNNMNRATIEKCDLNRFDLHCYGRDYYYKSCTLRNSSPFASMYGVVSYDRCTFDYAYPCLFRSDYNAYTPFDLTFNRCTFKMNKEHYYILYMNELSQTINKRGELQEKCFPNIKITKSKVYLDESVNKFGSLAKFRV